LTYLAKERKTNHHEVKGLASTQIWHSWLSISRWAQHRAWLNATHVPRPPFGPSPKDIHRIGTHHYHSAVIIRRNEDDMT